MSTSLGIVKPKCRSDWEEPTEPISNVTSSSQSLYLQLIGIIGVLLVILVIIIPVTFAISDRKTTTTTTTISTTITATTVTTTSTTVTSSTTSSPYFCSNMTILFDTDLPGNDITSISPMNFTVCCTNCLTMSACVAFTWSTGNVCYLKSLVGVNVSNTNLISAKY